MQARAPGRIFWWLCIAAAPPIGAAAAAAGYGMAIGDPVLDLTAIVAWSLAEEIVFRGTIQPALTRAHTRSSRPGTGRASVVTLPNLATSVLFAAAHLWQHTAIAAALVFPVSLVLGRARELSGRVWPAALLHVYFNVVLYAASALGAAAR